MIALQAPIRCVDEWDHDHVEGNDNVADVIDDFLVDLKVPFSFWAISHQNSFFQNAVESRVYCQAGNVLVLDQILSH